VFKARLYGKLRRFTDTQDPTCESVVRISVEDGDTIRDIIRCIGIPSEELGSNIFVNGEYSAVERKVKTGEGFYVNKCDVPHAAMGQASFLLESSILGLKLAGLRYP